MHILAPLPPSPTAPSAAAKPRGVHIVPSLADARAVRVQVWDGAGRLVVESAIHADYWTAATADAFACWLQMHDPLPEGPQLVR